MHLSEIVLVVAVCLLSICANSYGSFVEDYCWRDYDGIIPSDALKAGTDRKGRPIYIGQTLYDNKLIPGKIHENVNEIHIEFYEAFLINETIKILCSQHPEKFYWFKTKFDEILNLKNRYLFEGGYEKGVITYVGRTMSHGELTVGKVICWPSSCIKLTTIENGTWYPHGEFEILAYKPVVDKTNSSSYSSSPSFLTYFLLVLATAGLIVIVVLIVRRCKT